MLLMVGELLNIRYKIEKALGQGGKAEDVHLVDNRWYQDPMNQVFAENLFRWVTHMEE